MTKTRALEVSIAQCESYVLMLKDTVKDMKDQLEAIREGEEKTDANEELISQLKK